MNARFFRLSVVCLSIVMTACSGSIQTSNPGQLTSASDGAKEIIMLSPAGELQVIDVEPSDDAKILQAIVDSVRSTIERIKADIGVARANPRGMPEDQLAEHIRNLEAHLFPLEAYLVLLQSDPATQLKAISDYRAALAQQGIWEKYRGLTCNEIAEIVNAAGVYSSAFEEEVAKSYQQRCEFAVLQEKHAEWLQKYESLTCDQKEKTLKDPSTVFESIDERHFLSQQVRNCRFQELYEVFLARSCEVLAGLIDSDNFSSEIEESAARAVYQNKCDPRKTTDPVPAN